MHSFAGMRLAVALMARGPDKEQSGISRSRDEAHRNEE